MQCSARKAESSSTLFIQITLIFLIINKYGKNGRDFKVLIQLVTMVYTKKKPINIKIWPAMHSLLEQFELDPRSD